jgi:hypothetical protein
MYKLIIKAVADIVKYIINNTVIYNLYGCRLMSLVFVKDDKWVKICILLYYINPIITVL